MAVGDRDSTGDDDGAPAATGGTVAKPPRRKALSPQEKKALSYRRDRRNGYGESIHAARKNVPRAKVRSHRKLRHADKAGLRDVEAAIETVPLRLRKPGWKKSPDISLRLSVRFRSWCRAAAEARSRGEPEPERPNWREPPGI